MELAQLQALQSMMNLFNNLREEEGEGMEDPDGPRVKSRDQKIMTMTTEEEETTMNREDMMEDTETVDTMMSSITMMTQTTTGHCHMTDQEEPDLCTEPGVCHRETS